MRNLNDLFKEFLYTLHDLEIDPHELMAGCPEATSAAASVRVVGAYQPRYPLAGNLQNMTILSHEDDDSNSVVWLSVGSAPDDMNPYAPRGAFERY